MTGGVIEGRSVRLTVVLALLLLALVPFASGYLNPNVDMTEHAREGTCYCHDPLPSEQVRISVDVDEQVAWTPSNRSVGVSVGILGQPGNLTGFALHLNASDDPSNVKWEKRISNEFGPLPNVNDLLRVNGSAMWTIGELEERWFNVSFIPGNANQTIVLSVTGMRADDNGNETGDAWAVLDRTIEVREQRLMEVNVTVTNQQPYTVKDVLVDFYVDEEYIGNDTVDVPGNSEGIAEVEWDVTFKEDGRYRLRAEIDPQGRITETDRTNNEVTQDLWLGGPPSEEAFPYTYAIGSVVAGAAIIVLVFWYWQRRQYRF